MRAYEDEDEDEDEDEEPSLQDRIQSSVLMQPGASAREIAGRVGCSISTVQRACRDGLIFGVGRGVGRGGKYSISVLVPTITWRPPTT